MNIYMVSACLMGLKTRYDGNIVASAAAGKIMEKGLCIPFCPEQLGGLSTPRSAAYLVGGDGHDVLAGRARVLTSDGENVAENFILGAKQVIAIARMLDVTRVFLKAGSPSCGLTPKIGVTAALLQAAGLEVVEVE